MSEPNRVRCFCCGRLLSARTAREHARVAAQNQDLSDDENESNGGDEGSLADDMIMDPEHPPSPTDDPINLPLTPPHIPDEVGMLIDEEAQQNELVSIFRPPDWSEPLHEAEGEPPAWPDPNDDEWDNPDEGRGGVEPTEAQIQQWDWEWLEEAQLYYESGLTKDQMNNIIMYAIRLDGHLSRSTYNRIRRAYEEELDLRSEYRLQKLVDDLANLDCEIYHCCTNSCVLYVGDLANKEVCPHCSEARYDSKGQSRQTFLYIPLIPRLLALFSNPKTAETLEYRHRYSDKMHEEGWIKDIFDCVHYLDLCNQNVTVNGKKLSHKYFSKPDDIAFGLAGDGIQVFRNVKRGNATVTPLIVVNYNLPPHIRTRLSNVICLGVIPGPHGPKDTNSFLWPFKKECDKLAYGVPAYHAIRRESFLFHAYNIIDLGDIPWLSKVMCVKGQNGFCPCRRCDVYGVLKPPSGPYYVPLRHPKNDNRVTANVRDSRWDPEHLPLRPESGLESWQGRIEWIKEGGTRGEREARARQTGINGLSVVSSIPGIVMTRSFPYEGMHLFFENLIPNMINHWKGKFKTLGTDTGSENYVIEDSVWEIIGRETEEAVATIPSAFVGKLPNIATCQYLYKAEYYSFWFIYLAPILLENRFKSRKYYTHACDLSRILKACLELEITKERVTKLKQDIAQWVETYEKYYYQYKVERLSTCPLTIHGLLHVADDIIMSAPVWASWSFVMERFAGSLLAAVKSKRNPNAVLAQHAKRIAQLSHIKNKFNLHDRLDFTRETAKELSTKEITFEREYPVSVLRFPRKLQFEPDSSLSHKIAVYFKGRFEQPDSDWPTLEDIKARLPEEMPKWSKVRVRYGGDAIRGSDATLRENERDSSYVRYSQIADRNERWHKKPIDPVQEVHYGQLHSILVCHLKRSNILRLKEDRVFLLAHITPCNTSKTRNGRTVWPDATEEVVTYKEQSTSIIVDISVVEAAVGRVFYGTADKKWGIVDRSGEGARTTFLDDIDWDDDDDFA